jgi:hypothetical protein
MSHGASLRGREPKRASAVIVAVTCVRIVGLFFVCLSLLFIVLAVGASWETRNFLATARHAEGIVTKLNAGGSHPEIQFTAGDGSVVSYPQGGLIFGYRPGDKVDVLFTDGDPRSSAVVNIFGAVWFRSLLLGAIGAICAVGGGTTWLVSGS